MNRDVKEQIEHVAGTSVRQATNALLGVSSKDRKTVYPTFTTPYDFNLYSSQNYMNGFFTQVALTEIRFPWSIPPITPNTSKMTVFIYLSGVLQLPAVNIDVYLNPAISAAGGWATPDQLGAAVQGQINAAYPGSATVVSIVNPINPVFQMSGGINYAYGIQARTPPATPSQTTIYDMMGWIPGFSETAQSSQIGGKAINMLRTQFVDIVSHQLTYNQSVKDSDTGMVSRDLIARLYLVPTYPLPSKVVETGSTPFIVYKDYSTPKQIKWASNIPISAMSFQVYDDNGDLLTTGDPQGDYFLPDWDMTLQVTEV